MMKGKVCIVTGANSGIGYATAQGLAEQGAHVVMVCRSQERGEAARRQLAAHTGNPEIDLLTADYASLESVRELAAAFTSRYDKLDVLVNNAGGLFPTKQLSADGYEMTFAVNYLAPFLLIHLLLDKLKAAEAGRIVNVASTMQADRIDLDDAPNPARFASYQAYKTAKAALIAISYYLAERFEEHGIAVNALHPGAIYTPQSSRSAPAMFRPLLKLLMRSPEQGARLPLYLAASPEAAAVTGKYYKNAQPVRTKAITYDTQLQSRLYARSLEWVSLPAL